MSGISRKSIITHSQKVSFMRMSLGRFSSTFYGIHSREVPSMEPLFWFRVFDYFVMSYIQQKFHYMKPFSEFGYLASFLYLSSLTCVINILFLKNIFLSKYRSSLTHCYYPCICQELRRRRLKIKAKSKKIQKNLIGIIQSWLLPFSVDFDLIDLFRCCKWGR